MSRTYKKPYTKSKRFHKTCRNHGSCSYCYSNRMYRALRLLIKTNQELKEIQSCQN